MKAEDTIRDVDEKVLIEHDAGENKKETPTLFHSFTLSLCLLQFLYVEINYRRVSDESKNNFKISWARLPRSFFVRTHS